MKTLTRYIEEKLIIKKDGRFVSVVPKSYSELRRIITERSKKSPEYLDLSDIDVSQVNTFSDLSGFSIFSGCSTMVKTIDVTGWDVSHIKDFFGLFAYLSNLEEIKGINKWEISDYATTTKMFYKVPRKIIPSWYKG